jgi:hypothetical protein
MSNRTIVELLDANTYEPVNATFIEGVSKEELVTTDRVWRTFLATILKERSGLSLNQFATWDEYCVAAYREIYQRTGTVDNLPENPHWEWQSKLQAIGDVGYVFGIEYEEQIQCLLLVRTDRTCRLTDKFGKPLVYLDYLATAPWNQPELVSPPRLRGCGKTMIRAAIQWSIDRGWEGRIGLHSLPSAENFYRDKRICGMTDLGIDENYERLRYFEMSATQARDFFERSKK